MASPKTLELRAIKKHIYLPLRDEADPRILHTTSDSYFQKPKGQIVNPNAPINGRARKLAKKQRAKSVKKAIQQGTLMDM